MTLSPTKIRNIAIIAHIDHGKTTMLDALLKQSHIFRDNEVVAERAMDSNDQEKERGITIFAKPTSIPYKDYRINIIDTPGHADFSGEVERVLGMVDSVLLLVDAQEGPMPQTRFVLSKALKMGLCPIVVLNKIDRPHADSHRALNLTWDLFVELGANDKQLEFAHCYASGRSGFAIRGLEDERKDMTPLMDLIVEAVPAPTGELENPFQMQVSTLRYNEFVGRQACGRIRQGVVKKKDQLVQVDANGKETRLRVERIEGFLGLKTVDMEEAGAGDIIIISGFPDVTIGDTLCSPEKIAPLPPILLDEPTVSVNFMVNTSPFVGQDGKEVTMNKLRARLEYERRSNISLHMENISDDAVKVSGRGELHLAVLVEAMRRQGFELSLSKPEVVLKKVDNQVLEPVERVVIEVPKEYDGTIIEQLSKRKAELISLQTNEHDITSMEFRMPTRGLIGYRNGFLTTTRGDGILTSVFEEFQPWKGEITGRTKGVLVSSSSGRTTGFACDNLQSRGILFVQPSDQVYVGMVVGENSRDNDLEINVAKEKALTNVRASGKDENVNLQPPRKFTLEQAMDYIADDELIEVTPNFIRMRKRPVKKGVRG